MKVLQKSKRHARKKRNVKRHAGSSQKPSALPAPKVEAPAPTTPGGLASQKPQPPMPTDHLLKSFRDSISKIREASLTVTSFATVLEQTVEVLQAELNRDKAETTSQELNYVI